MAESMSLPVASTISHNLGLLPMLLRLDAAFTSELLQLWGRSYRA